MSYNFKNTLVRKPGKSISKAISSMGLVPKYEIVIKEHENYIKTLKNSGVNVISLTPLEDFPDSIFVEDPALTFLDFCIILRPGADTRFGEREVFESEAKEYFEKVFSLDNGTVEGGDVLRINNHFIIGLSDRTNKYGAEDLAKKLIYLGATVEISKTPKGILHFKSECSLLDDETIFLTRRMSETKFFSKNYRTVEVPVGEEIAANSLRVNENLIIPRGFNKTQELLSKNYNIKLLDVNEISKVDAGLSCMSIRW